MSREIVPVILCGGAGSRLWPLSRQLLPKQCLPLLADRSRSQEVREVVEDLKRANRSEHWVVVSARVRVTRGEDDIERFEDRYNGR